jgi:hypothetical protein
MCNIKLDFLACTCGPLFFHECPFCVVQGLALTLQNIHRDYTSDPWFFNAQLWCALSNWPFLSSHSHTVCTCSPSYFHVHKSCVIPNGPLTLLNSHTEDNGDPWSCRGQTLNAWQSQLSLTRNSCTDFFLNNTPSFFVGQIFICGDHYSLYQYWQFTNCTV